MPAVWCFYTVLHGVYVRRLWVAIRDGSLSIYDVWDHYRLGRWNDIPTHKTKMEQESPDISPDTDSEAS